MRKMGKKIRLDWTGKPTRAWQVARESHCRTSGQLSSPCEDGVLIRGVLGTHCYELHTGLWWSRPVGGEDSKTVLNEVAIEREGLVNAQAFRHGKAGRIGEEEALVVVVRDDLPGTPLIFRIDANDGDRAPVDLLKSAPGSSMPPSCKKESMDLGEYKVCGEKPPPLRNRTLRNGAGVAVIIICP